MKYACVHVAVASALSAFASLSTPAWAISYADERRESWEAVATRVESTSNPDSTAVVVLFDASLFDLFRARLPKGFNVLRFQHPDVPRNDAFERPQLGQMYKEASAATRCYPDVWVIQAYSSSTARKQAAWFAQSAASLHRSRALSDTIRTDRDTLMFARWIDRPGGVALREEMARSQAWADSVLVAARSRPSRVPITRPFSTEDLQIDRDTLLFYVAALQDTSYYSVGGCDEVQTAFWNASERLGRMGPGVVPVLVDRVEDPDPFVRERVQEALLLATQDERIMTRTGDDYIKFYDQPGTPPAEVVKAWWSKYHNFWGRSDTSRTGDR
jgi:hypothetical protein